MQLTAKLTQLLPIQTGTGKKGDWKKQQLIVQTNSASPKMICFLLWGDDNDLNHIKIGDELIIEFDIESREFNGKWYTDLKVLKIQQTESLNSIETDLPITDFSGISKGFLEEMREQTKRLENGDFF